MTLGPKEAKPKSAGSEPAGPIAWWKFDEPAGATTANAAGNKLQGQIQGQPRRGPGPGPSGQALEFDGLQNWVECADSSGLDFRQGVSVSAWFKVRAFDCPAQTLVAKGNVLRLERQSETNLLQFALTGLETTGASKKRSPTLVSKRAVDDGQWHSVIAAYDGKRLALYLDGVEEDAVTASGSISLNSLPVTLGENDASRGRYFNGWLDEVRLYDRGLSAEEIKSLGQKGLP